MALRWSAARGHGRPGSWGYELRRIRHDGFHGWAVKLIYEVRGAEGEKILVGVEKLDLITHNEVSSVKVFSVLGNFSMLWASPRLYLLTFGKDLVC